MNINADTNVLVRAAMQDHPAQSAQAAKALREAQVIAITLPALCEFVWVLARGYRKPPHEIALAIRRLMSVAAVHVDMSAAEAGLAMLEAGGDFADGVIAHEGRRLGGDVFVTFDQKAARLVAAGGGRVNVLGGAVEREGT